MKKQTRIIPSLLAATALSVAAMPAHADTSTDEAIQAQLQDYKATMQAFGKTLKGELQAAMKQGGPMAAVEVCNQRAPEIAADMSEESGYTLRRTSLKPRATEPTDWERVVLEEFEARQAAGTPVGEIAWHEVKEVGGEKQLRFMKAIATEGVCLSCHGQDVDPKLKAEIDRLYPDDQATGFEEGDIRGAFSVTAALED
ncbi:MAG: Tll0287-like domain-containing protein [Pseudomonadota bacterium]